MKMISNLLDRYRSFRCQRAWRAGNVINSTRRLPEEFYQGNEEYNRLDHFAENTLMWRFGAKVVFDDLYRSFLKWEKSGGTNWSYHNVIRLLIGRGYRFENDAVGDLYILNLTWRNPNRTGCGE